jgi:glucose-6-phosphate 1-dehydrogenase
MFQLLAFIAMEPPISFAADMVRDERVKVLYGIRPLSHEDVLHQAVRGQYGEGLIDGHPAPGYRDEKNVAPASATETFAALKLYVDNWRWADVPFILRTGKAIGRARREIVVRHRDVPHLAFGADYLPRPNMLRLELNPDRIALGLNVNGAGDPFDLEELELGADLAPEGLPAYARVLLAVLEGDPILSIRADEAEESWRIVEPILDGWASDAVPMLEYPAGSSGPAESDLGPGMDSDALVASGDTLPGAAG